jgi:hypothetical protein
MTPEPQRSRAGAPESGSAPYGDGCGPEVLAEAGAIEPSVPAASGDHSSDQMLTVRAEFVAVSGREVRR